MRALKRLLVFLLVLGIAVGGLYLWWQANAARVITGQVRQMSRGLVTNPEKLTVTMNKPVKLLGLNRALVPELVIAGQGLTLRDGPDIASARLELRDIVVTGPPFTFAGVGEGSIFRLQVTDAAVTAYLRKRGVKLFATLRMPMDTVNVAFLGPRGTQLTGEVKAPVGNLSAHLNAVGQLVPSSKHNEVDYRVDRVGLDAASFGLPRGLEGSLKAVNPVITVAEWPFLADVTDIKTGAGTVLLSGKVNGVRGSLLP